MDNKDKSNVCCKVCGKENEESNDMKFIRDDDANLILCEECIEVMHSAVNITKKEVKPTIAPPMPVRTPNPKEVYEFLNKHIISQDDAKRQISIGISQHYRRMKDPSIEKSNILIMGPTGTGKTELARSVAKYLDVPFVNTDATSFTTRGYAGEDVDSILLRLLQVCNFDVERAQKGIIFIDEIDKIAKSQNSDSQIATVSVQQELLKIMEGTVVKVSKNGKGHGGDILINTKNILFICAGSFIGIESIVNVKKEAPIGFFNATPTIDTSYDIPEKLEIEHLIKFGMIPEFIGRIPVVVHTRPLSKEDMIQIITEPENSIVKQYLKMLKIDGISATFDHSFLESVVVEALSKNLGARGIRKVLEFHLKDLFFNIDQYIGCEVSIGKRIEKKTESNVFALAR